MTIVDISRAYRMLDDYSEYRPQLRMEIMDWIFEHLGYFPKVLFEDNGIYIEFQNDTDALLFRINFSQKWKLPH